MKNKIKKSNKPVKTTRPKRDSRIFIPSLNWEPSKTKSQIKKLIKKGKIKR